MELNLRPVLPSQTKASFQKNRRELRGFAKFDQTPPPPINRHWALHGRDECNWNLADVVRLLNALETLVWLDEIRCSRPPG
jgi:hypothetical protein